MWFDALVTNVDRTPRNPNLLLWHDRVWLIDHGAALYLQHVDGDLAAHAHRPFPLIRDHVLLPYAGPSEPAAGRLGAAVTRELLEGLVALVPSSWLDREARGDYVEYLAARAGAAERLAAEIEAARA